MTSTESKSILNVLSVRSSMRQISYRVVMVNK